MATAARDQPDGYGEDKSPYAKDKSAPAPYPPGYLAYEDDDCKADDRQFYEVSRQNRWKYLGLVNEPGLRQWDVKGCDWKNDKKTDQEPFGKCGDAERFGLWLDKRVGAPDPFEDEKKYPGVKIGARGNTVPVGSYYGMPAASSACVSSPIPSLTRPPSRDGIRSVRHRPRLLQRQTPRASISGRDVVRLLPRRAESGRSAERPRESGVEEPELEPGYAVLLDRPNLFLQFERTARELHLPAFSHLSAGLARHVARSSDNINNPRTMNAVYSIAARLQMAEFLPEKLTGGRAQEQAVQRLSKDQVALRSFLFRRTRS